MRAPNLAEPEKVRSLTERNAPYWNILEYCRHIGIEKRAGRPAYWLARIRRSDGGYRQTRLAIVSDHAADGADYAGALCLARGWFSDPKIRAISPTPYAVGVNRTPRYEKTVPGFTIGDAMKDYVKCVQGVHEALHRAGQPGSFGVVFP